MKKLVFAAVLAFSVSALADDQVGTYECGLAVGKAIVELSTTAAKDDVVELSNSIADYDAQIKLAVKEKDKEMKQMIFSAANSSQQSILFSLAGIRKVSAAHADVIEKACGLAGPQ